MAGTAVRGRLTWQTATVATVTDETPAVRTLVLAVPDWGGHRAGQHLDIRLTGDDGYQAERSYSIASAPGEPLAITVERLEDGEVSPYLTQDVLAGDEIEVRGPIGGYFVWDGVAADSVPLLLAAGGSGVVPLRAILRHRSRIGSSVPVRLLYSVRSMADVIYRSELSAPADGVQVSYTLTRQQPPGWTGYARRVDQAMMTEVAWPASGASGAAGLSGPLASAPLAYVCGPTNFVEAVAADLVALGYPPQRVKTERFGATGTPLLVSGIWVRSMEVAVMEALEDGVLDGNAIGGMLIELFGAEMTTAVGTCGSCGTAGQVAEMAVYQGRMGMVVRCRVCDNVLMVFVEVRGVTCVDLRGLASLV